MVGPQVQIGDHSDPGTTARVTVRGLRKMPGWTFHVGIDITEGRAVVVGIETLPPPGQALTAATWRSIPIGEVIRLAEASTRDLWLELTAQTLGVEPGPRPYGGSVDHLRAVADLYRFALSQGRAPRDTVAAAHGVSTKTVSRWLSEARRTIDPDTGSPVLGSYADEQAAHGLTTREQQQVREDDRRRAEQDR